MKLHPRFFENIENNRKRGYAEGDPGQYEVDFNLLYAFADYVFNDLGLDLSKNPTYFSNDAEPGCGDLQDWQEGLSLGEEIDIHLGYYTSPETYRMVAILKNELCPDCQGKGCDDWAGQDCPSDEFELRRVRDLFVKNKP